jgi:hypothetical protein
MYKKGLDFAILAFWITDDFNFVGATIGGQCLLLETQIGGHSTFDFSTFKGGLFCTDPGKPSATSAVFKKNVTFLAVAFTAHAVFLRASFQGTCGFDNSRFGCDARFDGVDFARDVASSAIPSRIGQNISFAGVVFEKQTVFRDAHFHSACSFREAHFNSESLFYNAVFGGPINFDGAYFEGPLYFHDREGFKPATVSYDLSFKNTKASDVFFTNVVFGGLVCLQGATFKVAHFRNQITKDGPAENKQFSREKSLDLRGFTYEGINAAWGEIAQQIEPFDKSAYFRLEKALRSVGGDAHADGVYIAQRTRSRRNYHSNRDYLRWVADVPNISGFTLVTTVTGIGPADEIWYNPGDERVYFGGIFGSPVGNGVASALTPFYSVIATLPGTGFLTRSSSALPCSPEATTSKFSLRT